MKNHLKLLPIWTITVTSIRPISMKMSRKRKLHLHLLIPYNNSSSKLITSNNNITINSSNSICR